MIMNKETKKKLLTYIIPLIETIVPAKAGSRPKCDSAKLIPIVSNDPMLPFVVTFKSIQPIRAASYTVIKPKHVIYKKK